MDICESFRYATMVMGRNFEIITIGLCRRTLNGRTQWALRDGIVKQTEVHNGEIICPSSTSIIRRALDDETDSDTDTMRVC
jgi:hypothetical protein